MEHDIIGGSKMLKSRRIFSLAVTASLVGMSAALPVAVAVPDVGPDRDHPHQLVGVDVVSSNDVWAVGHGINLNRPLVFHWNGSHWRHFNTALGLDGLNAVDHVSSTDVWAGGQGGIIHWDGSTWTKSYEGDLIESIVAVESDDIWAVGLRERGGGLILHWDGSTWNPVGNPDPDAWYRDVDADAADDVWVVGAHSGGHGVVEHWNGSSWQHFDTYGGIRSVTAVSPSDVWIAVSGLRIPEFMHYDGQQFSDVNLPGIESGDINSISAVTATDIWAVGDIERKSYRAVIAHWDGTKWSLVPPPAQPGVAWPQSGRDPDVWLYDVDARASNDVWAAGYQFLPPYKAHALAYHWDGSVWTREL